MSSARERILNRISEARGGATKSPGEILAEAQGLIPDSAISQPAFHQQTTIDRFFEKATSERLTATLAEVGDIADVPQAAVDYFAEHGLAHRAAIAPALASLDWTGTEITTAIDANQEVSITLADGGIAETGSLIFRSSPDTPMLHNYLGLHHIAVLRRESVARYLEEAIAGAEDDAMPRILSLVTGTSGTADIEAVNIRGAHGPRYLHIVVVG